MSQYLLAIDQGTTSSRAIVFTRNGEIVSQYQIDLTQYFPYDGWVEHDPEEMWTNTLECCRKALSKAELTANDIAAVGITNQRETTIIWDRKTGKPIYRAIVWQDRRTGDLCKELSQHAISATLQDKTGLLLDPYFSATKIMWLLTHIPDARARAERGELAFGTVDSFLLSRLTKGKVHATDATNASRTLLFNIEAQMWDQEILNAFEIPPSILPMVLDSSADFGKVDAEFLGAPIPITALVGDQQAATVGQACFSPGMVKSTYGTGCFMLLNTGSQFIRSKHHLLATVAYRINGEVTYGLEGSIFSAGVSVKWLRDHLKIIKNPAETEMLAQSVTDTGGVYLVPAFTGLGAPYWDPDARAAIIGLTRNSGIEHIVRAALEAVGYQTRDLLHAMTEDSQTQLTTLRVDGGMVVNNWLLQFLADILNLTIHRPACVETTALGAVYLAGLQVGFYQSLEDISQLWQANQIFLPKMRDDVRRILYQGWKNAVNRVINNSC
ncbi:MAG: glycerol kinase GlpK [Gammaproteobacteria bacterium]